MYNSSLLDDIRWLEAFLYGGPEPDLPEWEMTNRFVRMQRQRRDLETKREGNVWYLLKYDPVKKEFYRVFLDDQKADK